jgi:hypothetical protein
VDQVCQQTSDFGEGERDELAARAFGAVAAVPARKAAASMARMMWRYQSS